MPNFSERTIDRFKTKLAGGGARSNLFEVSFGSAASSTFSLPFDPAIQLSSDDYMLIKSAGLPASTISEIPVPFRGRTLKIAGDRTFDVWTITIINDADFKWRNLFERWMNYMVKVSDGSGTINPNLYMVDMNVSQLSRGAFTGLNTPGTQGGQIDVLRKYIVHGVFPTAVSQIDLSYNNENEIEEFTVDLQVQWWEAADAANSAPSQVI
jgi:hypothetical protein